MLESVHLNRQSPYTDFTGSVWQIALKKSAQFGFLDMFVGTSLGRWGLLSALFLGKATAQALRLGEVGVAG